MIAAILLLCVTVQPGISADRLSKEFVSPPDSARIWVYWFWLNGNLTKEGMTADLEAMKKANVGGVLIMEVDQGAPVGPVAFMGDKWRELFKHMVSEAARLGIEVNMNNDAGWNGSGGPWVPLDKAMQVIVTSEKQVPGGTKFEGELPKPRVNGGFYRDIAVLAFPTPKDPTNLAYRIRNLDVKGMFWGWHNGSLDASTGSGIPAESLIAKDKILDLTSQMDVSGKLTWSAPMLKDSLLGQDHAGPVSDWTVIRFGHTFTGAKSHPAPATGAGPECDKLSKEGIEANYYGMIGKLAKDVGPLAGKAFAATHVDSWEVGAQNWTPKMREEFKKRRGYDMMPFMPVLTGRVVDSLEISERFLWDVRQTVSDLLAENYIGHLRKIANKDGLRLSMESYTTPANDLDVANHVEEPICEFWWPDGGGLYWSVKSMASTAHVNGRPIVGAEAFTADSGERWRAHPAIIKTLGDRAFCDGVNRFIVHRYAMQPWVDNRLPGMTMGPWGLHYERSQTWWNDSIAWHQYVARCQYMLRQGTFVADVLSLQPEEAMQRFSTLSLPGYDYDGISPQAFMKDVSVKRGSLKLPSGMNYRLLVLPDRNTMTPQMLDKIEDLVEAGATIIGKPPVKSPSLSGYPKCDEEVQETVKELWGTASPAPSGDRKVGKGRVVWGKSVPEVLADMKVKPDFTSSLPIRYIHRALNDLDIYFVANPNPQPAEAVCTFRVSGKSPEAWFPDTGRMEPVSVFEESDGCTSIPLKFEPAGSMFIVFKKGVMKASEKIVSLRRNDQELIKTIASGAAGGNSDVTNTFTMVAWVKPNAEIALPQETADGITALNIDRNDVVYAAPGHEVWKEGDSGAGFGAGKNGVCVYEHGGTYFPAVLVHAAPISDWTHVAVVYQDGTPSLYLNGQFARKGLKGKMVTHSAVGVSHGRELKSFNGQVAGLKQFKTALSAEEIVKLAQSKPAGPDIQLGPAYDLVSREIGQNGNYEIKTADGKSRQVTITDLPAPLEIKGPWELKFTPGWGAPEKVTLDNLISWTEHSDSGVKYFSGSATYQKQFTFEQALKSELSNLKSVVYLDLGKVAVMAAVKLNGKNLGILWKPPYRVDITSAVKTGQNDLEIRVVNLWINRMIGDEFLAEDSERNNNGTLKQWPQWLQEGKPSPAGRLTFTSWRLWKKDQPLQESGLLGPVTIQAVKHFEIK